MTNNQQAMMHGSPRVKKQPKGHTPGTENSTMQLREMPKEMNKIYQRGCLNRSWEFNRFQVLCQKDIRISMIIMKSTNR